MLEVLHDGCDGSDHPSEKEELWLVCGGWCHVGHRVARQKVLMVGCMWICVYGGWRRSRGRAQQQVVNAARGHENEASRKAVR